MSTSPSIGGISSTSFRRVTSLVALEVVIGVLLMLPFGASFVSPVSSSTTAAAAPHIHAVSTRLNMGGLNKIKGKQADLKRKLDLAKQQKREAGGHTGDDSEEIKERNERKRFEQLLEREGSKMLNDYDSDGYLSIKQEEEEISAARKYIIFRCLLDCSLCDTCGLSGG
jgi:hypothetical protein